MEHSRNLIGSQCRFHSSNFKKLCLAVVGVLTIFLAGCGGGGGGSSSQTVTVTGSLGQFRNAEACLLDLDLVEIVDPVELDANGEAVFEIPRSVRQVIAVIKGDADAEYFDESEGDYLAFPAGQQIRAIVSDVGSAIGVTTFTELAVANLESAVGGLPEATAETIDAANELVRTEFLPGLEDITIPPTLIGSDTDMLGTSIGDLYAAMLAAYAELASGKLAPALAILDQLREDFSDGLFDSMDDGEPLVNDSIDLSDFEMSLDVALTSALSVYGDGSLLIEDLLSISDGNLILVGDWTLRVTGTVTAGGVTEEITEQEQIVIEQIPASAVPTEENEDFSDIEDLFTTAFGQLGSASNVVFDVRSESSAEVVIDFSATLSIEAQEIEGFQIPASVSDFDLVFTYTRT